MFSRPKIFSDSHDYVMTEEPLFRVVSSHSESRSTKTKHGLALVGFIFIFGNHGYGQVHFFW